MKVTFTFSALAALVAAGALVVVPTVSGCAASPASAPVTPSDEKWASQRWPGTTLGDLTHGHDVFVSRCSSCHSLPRPDVKSPEQWGAVLDEMGARAKLSAAERDLVNRYLSAASQRLRSPATLTRAEAGNSSL